MDNFPFENDADYNDDLPFQAAQIEQKPVKLAVAAGLAGSRLDAALAKLLPDYSRSRLSGWIKDGAVSLNGKPASPKDKLIGGEESKYVRSWTKKRWPLPPKRCRWTLCMKTTA